MTVMEEFLEYKRHESELRRYQDDVMAVSETLASSIVQVLLFENASLTVKESNVTDTNKEITTLKQQVQKLQADKRNLEKKRQAEKLLLESKIELHKKNLKFFQENGTTVTGAAVKAPSSITSNKLITSKTSSHSMTPFLQKIKQTKVTPINPKLRNLPNFTTSTPDTDSLVMKKTFTPLKSSSLSNTSFTPLESSSTSPLRDLLKNNTTKETKKSMFDDDEGVNDETVNDTNAEKKYRKIKLPKKKKSMIDDYEEEEENAEKSPVFKRLKRNIFNDKGLSPLKTNNIFRV